MEDFPPFIALPLQLTAIAVEQKVELGSLRRRSHLLLEHQSSSLLVFHYLVLEVVDLVVSLVDLLGHLQDMEPSFGLVPLKVLNMLIGYLQLIVLRQDQLFSVVVLHVALLDLIFFREDVGADALVNLAEQIIESVVGRVHFGDLLKRVQVG